MLETIKPEVLATWMTPSTALARGNSVIGSSYLAAHGLVQRLAGGLMIAGASTGVLVEHDRETRHQSPAIPKTHWEGLQGPVELHAFWRTGDGEWWLSGTTKVAYYGLRFEPGAVKAWLATMAPHPEPSPQPVAQALPSNADAGLKGVPKALLEEWFALFQKANPDAAEALAVQAARAMFPGKSITRDRVRELFGPRKRGRKAKGVS